VLVLEDGKGGETVLDYMPDSAPVEIWGDSVDYSVTGTWTVSQSKAGQTKEQFPREIRSTTINCCVAKIVSEGWKKRLHGKKGVSVSPFYDCTEHADNAFNDAAVYGLDIRGDGSPSSSTMRWHMYDKFREARR
jgi:hypothetical protein